MTLRFSIITVALNNAATITDTLRSVAAQSYRHYEHWVIDGLSRDATAVLVKAHGGPATRLVSEPDRGVYDAMNKGIALAGGDIIGFINGDDFYAAQDVLAEAARAFSNPDVDACYGDLCYVRRRDPSAMVRYWRSGDFRPGAFAKGWCPPHPTFFARRKIYQRWGVFDPAYTLAADFELMLRFLEVHRVRARYIPRVLVKMRLGGLTNRPCRQCGGAEPADSPGIPAHHRVPVSPLRLALGKLGSRGFQFVTRPRRTGRGEQ